MSEIIISNDMNDADREQRRKYFRDRGEDEYYVVTDSEWVCAYFSTTGIELTLLFLDYLWWALEILIRLKIDGPYFEHLQRESERAAAATTAYIIGNNQQNLVLIGYDENGNPVYSQQNFVPINVQGGGQGQIQGGQPIYRNSNNPRKPGNSNTSQPSGSNQITVQPIIDE